MKRKKLNFDNISTAVLPPKISTLKLSGMSGENKMANKRKLCSIALASIAMILTLGGIASAAPTTPDITWSNPADITVGTALGDNQLNAVVTDPNTEETVPGTVTYTPPAGTQLEVVQAQNLHVDFTPTDTETYNSASKDVSINVTQSNS